MNFFASNIKYLRKKKGLTQSDLANKIGINRPKIGSYEEARAEPKLTTIQRISHFFKVDIDDLLELDLSKEQPKEKDVRGSSIRILPIIVDKNDQEQITVVPVKASAGYLNGFSDVEYVEQLPTFNLPVNELSTNRTYRIFQIEGDSMLPITSGSYIISEYVQNWENVKDGQAYIVISQNEGIVYKRVKNLLQTDQLLELQSDNAAYPTFNVSRDDLMEVWQAKGIISFNLDKPNVPTNQLSKMNTMLMQLQREMKELKSGI